MTPEARKAFLEAAQVCDNVAQIAQEQNNVSIMIRADQFSLWLRLEVEADKEANEEATLVLGEHFYKALGAVCSAFDAQRTASLHEKRDGEADGATQ